MRAAILSIGAAILTFAGAPAFAQASPEPVRLVPHRAIYDLTLVRSSGTRGVENARGRIAFDFGGDACDGYTLKYRQVTVLEGGETGARTLDVRTATFESGDGTSMRFKTDSAMEGVTDSTIDGDAEAKADGTIAVRLKRPSRENLEVPGKLVFPSEHMKRLITAARSGENSLAIKLFDGSDNGKKIYDTLAMIGRRIEPASGGNLEEAARQDGLATLARWPMTVSYFASGAGDQTPAYTISFEIYENGVSRDLKLDYGDFALKGELQRLDLQPYSACQR